MLALKTVARERFWIRNIDVSECGAFESRAAARADETHHVMATHEERTQRCTADGAGGAEQANTPWVR
jgi:hypothetical protein